MIPDPQQIRSIVFDLDGTLYVSKEVAGEIRSAAIDLVAETRGMTREKGRKLLEGAHQRLSETLEEEPTLTRTCQELGIEVAEFHRALQERVRPERYLEFDPILYALLDSLRNHCGLYLYTNNSLPLTQKILTLLGVEDLFDRLYTIEFCWLPKPEPEAFQRVLEDIGGPPGSFIFVGDRHHVDLKLPESLGIPVLLTRETSDLLQIHKLLGLIP